MLQAASRRDDDFFRHILALDVAFNHAPVDLVQGLGGAQNRLAQGIVRPGRSQKEIMNQLVRGILVHADFLFDDPPFLIHSGAVKLGLEKHV